MILTFSIKYLSSFCNHPTEIDIIQLVTRCRVDNIYYFVSRRASKTISSLIMKRNFTLSKLKLFIFICSTEFVNESQIMESGVSIKRCISSYYVFV